MKIPKFLDDLSVISKLGDNPGADNGLTAEGLKAKFDEAGLKLQTFLNETLIEKINSLFSLDAPPHEGMNMTGPINMNKNKLGNLADPIDEGDAVNLGYAKKVGNPHNLLVNSDFRNPVNQRGINSGDVITNSYWIDRWMLTNKSTVTLGDGYINISANMNFPAYLRQFFETEIKFPCTFSMRTVDDIFTFVFTGYNQRRTMENGMYCAIQKTNNFLDIYIPQDLSISIVNMALYDGEYTAETLPEYKPKGYGAELADCQRYFYAISGSTYSKAGFGQAEGNNAVYPMVTVPVPMRVRPTVTYSGNWKLWDGSTEIAIASIAINAGATSANNCSQVSLTVNAASAITVGKMYTITVRNDATAYLWLSADL